MVMPVWMNLRKHLNVYVFNYTNVERFLNGSDLKIKVEEVGPYAYKDFAEKTNLKDFGDFVTFQVSFEAFLGFLIPLLVT